MSDSVPPRTDTVNPEQQAPNTGRGLGEIATVPASDLTNAETIERMAERLRFYESFDELIQQNISRSGQLMREAGEKRDEAIATIAQSRQQVETERETQRAALTELLDDVMTIQQATERLAHRVSDALEQIEFELEPIGLHDTGSLASRQSGRLPARFSTGSDPFQSVAEAVDDEYRLGVLGQPRLGTSVMPSASVPHGVESAGSNHAGAWSAPEASESTSGSELDRDVLSALDGEQSNPENAELNPNESSQFDAGELDHHTSDRMGDNEPLPGTGEEAAPIQGNATAWELDLDADSGDAVESNPDGNSDDLTSVVEPYAEANIEPYAEQVEPDGEALTSAMQIPSDVSDENIDADQDSYQPLASEVSSAPDTGSDASALSFDTEPLISNATGPDVLSTEETDSLVMEAGEDETSTLPTAANHAEDGLSAASGIDRPDVSSTEAAVAADSADVSVAPSPAFDRAIEPIASPVLATTEVSAPLGTPTPVAPVVELTEQQTTVVLDGVPRAAIALAIQRHILSKPDVLRAEVREYYDHRLTLFVTSRKATTAEDLQDWDGSATWEQIRTTPELLELRMVM